MNEATTPPVYETFSWYMFILAGVFRVFCLVLIVSAIINFSENYIATSIGIALGAYAFLKAGQSSIAVYHDRFVCKQDSFLNLMNTSREFLYSDIKSVSINGFLTLTLDIADDFIPFRTNITPWNKIHVEFKDGTLKSISTRVYKGDLKKALNYIRKEFQEYKLKAENNS